MENYEYSEINVCEHVHDGGDGDHGNRRKVVVANR